MFDLLTKASASVQSASPRVSSKVADMLREGRASIGMNLARDILAECYYEPQRGRDKTGGSHVELYAEQMKRGMWKAGSQIALARVDGRLYLVNGYHRMYAVSESGKAQVFQVLIQDFKSLDDVGPWYYSFDHLMRQRSDRQIMGAAGLFDDYSDIRRELASSAYRTVWLLGTNLSVWSNVQKPKIWSIPDYVSASLELWRPALRNYNAAMNAAGVAVPAFYYTSGVLAVALATMRHQPHKAAEFWSEAIKDDGLKRTDPRRALNMWRQRPKTVGGSFDSAAACSIAWNAFFDGEPLSLIRIGEKRSLKLAGTPFKGGKK